jgi:hypothetical protein
VQILVCCHMQVHGILMVSAFGVLIPLGVFTSRYGKLWKHWFNTHRAVQVLSVIVPASDCPGMPAVS